MMVSFIRLATPKKFTSLYSRSRQDYPQNTVGGSATETLPMAETRGRAPSIAEMEFVTAVAEEHKTGINTVESLASSSSSQI